MRRPRGPQTPGARRASQAAGAALRGKLEPLKGLSLTSERTPETFERKNGTFERKDGTFESFCPTRERPQNVCIFNRKGRVKAMKGNVQPMKENVKPMKENVKAMKGEGCPILEVWFPSQGQHRWIEPTRWALVRHKQTRQPILAAPWSGLWSRKIQHDYRAGSQNLLCYVTMSRIEKSNY